MSENNEMIVIVRLRGQADTEHSVKKTLSLLRLHKVNHAVVFQKNPTLEGMLDKAKDRVTWGSVDKKTLIHLIKKRGELTGRKKITDAYIKKNTEFKSISDFAKALLEGNAKLTDIPEFRPVFRLSPPKKGFKSLKNPVTRNGDLGYRGEEMSKLIMRMA